MTTYRNPAPVCDYTDHFTTNQVIKAFVIATDGMDYLAAIPADAHRNYHFFECLTPQEAVRDAIDNITGNSPALIYCTEAARTKFTLPGVALVTTVKRREAA